MISWLSLDFRSFLVSNKRFLLAEQLKTLLYYPDNVYITMILIYCAWYVCPFWGAHMKGGVSSSSVVNVSWINEPLKVTECWYVVITGKKPGFHRAHIQVLNLKSPCLILLSTGIGYRHTPPCLVYAWCSYIWNGKTNSRLFLWRSLKTFNDHHHGNISLNVVL